MQEAINKIVTALMVLRWCQENADEKWMVDHLLLVKTDIDQALARLREVPKPTKFTKEMREKYKYSIKNKLCIYAGSFVKALDIIEQQAEIRKSIIACNKLTADANDRCIKQLQADLAKKES